MQSVFHGFQRHPQQPQQFLIQVEDVRRGRGGGDVGVKERCSLAGLFQSCPQPTAAGKAEQRRTQQSLQVQHKVISTLPQLPEKSPQCLISRRLIPAAHCLPVEQQQPVDTLDALKQSRQFRSHHPVERGLRTAAAQRRQHRQRMHNIPQ